MERITRRLFLRNTAAASAVVATVAAPAAVEAAQEENPELLRIVNEMTLTETAIERAMEEKDAARARYEAIAPTVPDEMVVPMINSYAHPLRHAADAERDCFGDVVCRDDPRRARQIVNSCQFKRQAEHLLTPTRGRLSASQKWARDYLVRVEAHEAAVQKAKDTTGCDEALFALQRKFSHMESLRANLPNMPPEPGKASQ